MPSAIIGALRAELSAGVAKFAQDLGKASGVVAKFAASFKSAGKVIATSVAAGVTAAAYATKQAIDNMDQLSKTAQKVGLPTEEISALAHAANLSDVNLEQLTSGLVKFTKNASDAAAGTGEARKGFKALGIDVKNADGTLKSSSQLLLEVADKFAGYKDGAEKTALAVNLFGKSGAELIPLLNAGADGIREMTDEAAALGLVIDTQTGKQAEAFNDNLTRMMGLLKGVWNRVAAQLLPMLVKLSDRFFSTARAGDTMGKAADVIASGLKLATSAGALLVGVLKTVGEFIGGVAAALIALATGRFREAGQIVKAVGSDMLANVKGTWGTLKDIWVETGAEIEQQAPAVSNQIAAPAIEAEEKVKDAATKIEQQVARFAKAVSRQAFAVKSFANESLPPLEEALARVDDRYERLREEIELLIQENEELAASNDAAAQAMARLKQQLEALERAHNLAREAAIAQHKAEQEIANFRAEREQADIARRTEELRRERGDFGPSSQQAAEMREIQSRLESERMDAQQKLMELEAQRMEAERVGDLEAMERLSGIIALQRQYLTEVENTTAEQIVAANRLQDAYDELNTHLTNALDEMIEKGKISRDTIKDLFGTIIGQLLGIGNVFSPTGGGLGSLLTSGISAMFPSFGGGLAKGGLAMAGRPYLVGERGMELFRPHVTGTVDPDVSRAGGVTQVFNITTPDANSFRRSERQIVRSARLALAKG